jgi:membrane-associated protease RseP (regulator of RpoE activity)
MFVLTFLAFVAVQAIHALATAGLARVVGLPVVAIQIGLGPHLLRWRWGGADFCISPIPLGAAVSFENSIAIAPETDIDQPTLPPAKMLLLSLVGSTFVLACGLLLLAAPIWLGENQWVVREGEAPSVSPCAMPELVVSETKATWDGQFRLISDTAGAFFVRLVTYQDLDGWGAIVGFLATAVSMAHHSLASWLSAIGILFITFGLAQLLPAPPWNGFQFLQAIYGLATGKLFPFKVRLALTYVGVIFAFLVSLRMLAADVRWLYSLWS